MKSSSLTPWKAEQALVLPDSETRVPRIIEVAKQLRPRESEQIVASFRAQHFEVAATYVWHRTIALLKKQLSTLGAEFIGELLQRPDIDGRTEIMSAISETEAITLAQDLGMLTTTQTMRLLHSQEVVNHFASVATDEVLEDAEMMTKEEAVSCLRICVQTVLGHERIAVARDFAAFRKELESQTFESGSPEIVRLQQSPYFFIRTAISTLLSLIRNGTGAQLEHSSRNALLIIPMFWQGLKKPERWQIGQTYAAEFNEGKKESVKALHGVLLAVRGFDYVPENLRSNAFSRVASQVIAAHQGMNNFYNEPAPMRELANLGTSIPGPALAVCMTAVLCVKLGNQFGVSFAAQDAADSFMRGISKERWVYYLDERLENDRTILPKLWQSNPLDKWVSIIRNVDIDPSDVKGPEVRKLIASTKQGDKDNIRKIALRMFQANS